MRTLKRRWLVEELKIARRYRRLFAVELPGDGEVRGLRNAISYEEVGGDTTTS
jgi:hypothetical protein